MKQIWPEEELIEHFTLSSEEIDLLKSKAAPGRLGFAVLLKCFQYEGRFLVSYHEIPKAVISFIAEQLEITSSELAEYRWDGKTLKRHRTRIREYTGYNAWRRGYLEQLVDWLASNSLPENFSITKLIDAAYRHLRENKIEPPAPVSLERIVKSAHQRWEDMLFVNIVGDLAMGDLQEMDKILQSKEPLDGEDKDEQGEQPSFRTIKAEAHNASVDSILEEASKLEVIGTCNIPTHRFKDLPVKVLQRYRDRVITEPAREMRRHPPTIRYALMSIFLYMREREITDGLLDQLIRVVHKFGKRAETKIEKEVIEEIRQIKGKDELLYKIACAANEHPDDAVKDAIYPVVSEQTIQDIIREYGYSGSSYTRKVNTRALSSYRHHYRRLLPRILKILKFQSNNPTLKPLVDAVEALSKYVGSRLQYYPDTEDLPLDDIVPSEWKHLVVTTDSSGEQRVERAAYEVCVLRTLREKLRCKEMWVEGADRYRNPDEDLPADFATNRTNYYDQLNLPPDAESFISKLQKQMADSLDAFNSSVLSNKNVAITKKHNRAWIKLSPLDKQVEPPNLVRLKDEVSKEWPIVSLLDILKETDLRVNFTRHFESVAQRELLDPQVLQKRVLLNTFAFGPNAGLKRVASGGVGENYSDLQYVRRRFFFKEYLRSANADVVNAILSIRLPNIWGEATTSCASDSKHFPAWDQNLMTEWHARYGGRGVMIYWHVDKSAICIYSQLKHCSSSEVASMIEGVMRHCTDEDVDKQYVDTHGQSFVGFAFCHLLGFQLLPRLKGIQKKKLYRPYAGEPSAYKNLQPILSRPINWKLIRQQYDNMIKYATAIRLGTADTESILRRFTRENRKHPTYQALVELGKALRTVFLCDYLMHEELRREIQEGLNVIELWNGVNDFIFFGRGGEFASNKKGSQELSVLSLQLLQNSLVYINTLTIQQVLQRPDLMAMMTKEDFRGLTPLFFSHINPYGTFHLDMDSRIPFATVIKDAA